MGIFLWHPAFSFYMITYFEAEKHSEDVDEQILSKPSNFLGQLVHRPLQTLCNRYPRPKRLIQIQQNHRCTRQWIEKYEFTN